MIVMGCYSICGCSQETTQERSTFFLDVYASTIKPLSLEYYFCAERNIERSADYVLIAKVPCANGLMAG